MNERLVSRYSGPDGNLAAIDDPIAFIRQDHDRLHEVCDHLEDLPNALDSGLDLNQTRSILDFLTRDLPRHVADEEIDLFATLSLRCKDAEGVELVLAELSAEHDLDLDLVEPVRLGLRSLLDNGTLDNRERFLMDLRAFAETQRRHLLWENRVILPLAEKYLTAADKIVLSTRLLARRREVPVV